MSTTTARRTGTLSLLAETLSLLAGTLSLLAGTLSLLAGTLSLLAGTLSLLAGTLSCVATEEPGDPYADELVSFAPADGTFFGHDRLPEVVLGPPGGLYDVASLGCEGEIVLRFDEPGILDGPGVDLIVFENSFGPEFPEPGEVAVSDDGQRWFVFPCDPVTLDGCAGVTPTRAYPGTGLSPTDPAEAGGDGFDLAALPDAPAQVFYVRIRDRSREYWTARGELPYCDPGQQGAGGFDLDAVASVHG